MEATADEAESGKKDDLGYTSELLADKQPPPEWKKAIEGMEEGSKEQGEAQGLLDKYSSLTSSLVSERFGQTLAIQRAVAFGPRLPLYCSRNAPLQAVASLSWSVR